MSIMDEEKIPEDIRKALILDFEGHELVQYLCISIEDVLEAFNDQIMNCLEDLQCDLLDYSSSDRKDDDYEE